MFVGEAEAMLKGESPLGALIGGASTASPPAVLNRGEPAIWNGEAGGMAVVACMTGDGEDERGSAVLPVPRPDQKTEERQVPGHWRGEPR